MSKGNDVKSHYHETFFNALRNKTTMKRWGQEETLPLEFSPGRRTAGPFALVSFSAQA